MREGEELFGKIVCATCHVPKLRLADPVYRDPSPYNPIGNLRTSDVKSLLEIDLRKHGQQPRLAPESDGSVLVPAFTDFKRHDLGPDCDNENARARPGANGSVLDPQALGLCERAAVFASRQSNDLA